MFRRHKRRLVNVKVVDEQDFSMYLKSLGVLDKVIDEKARCRFCGNKLQVAQIEAVFPLDGEICFVCSNPKCIDSLSL